MSFALSRRSHSQCFTAYSQIAQPLPSIRLTGPVETDGLTVSDVPTGKHVIVLP
jgi:hypothetical protein